MENLKYIIDCISNDNYFVITYSNGNPYTNISKHNSLDNIILYLGQENIGKIIQ